MKILHVSAIKGWGGGENHLENLCYELNQNSEAQNSVFCVKNGIVHQRLTKTNTPFFTSPLAYKMDFRFFLKLGAVCKSEKIDLIHIHDTTALTLVVMGDIFRNLPPFIFSKKTSFPIKNRKRTLHKYNYPKIKKILCVSEKTMKISSLAIRNHDKLTTIYHGTRLDNKSELTPFNLREKLKLEPNQKIIGNIANHIRAKSLETFIEVAHSIVNEQQRKDLVFVQIGNFSNKTEELKKTVEQLNLQDYVFFLGFLPNASNFISQFDISLMTSQSEGIPGFIYESFYHRTPVVSTNVGGIPEIITDGENGLLADVHDHEKLSRHLLFLSSKPSLKKQFTDISKRRLHEKFSSTMMAQQTLLEYQKIINGKF